MSNPYRHEVPQPQPQQAARPAEEQLEELVCAAIQTLYLARGGDDLEQQIKVARINIDNALKCRESEALRLEKDPHTMREKGERPLVTVSEDRLHSRELTRLRALRDDLRLWCRNSIHEAMQRSQPRSLEEVQKVLARAAKDIDGVGNMLRARALEDKPQSQNMKLEEAAEQMLKVMMKAGDTFMAKHAGRLTPDMRAHLQQALQSQDIELLYTEFGNLPLELRSAFEVEMNALLAG